MKRSVRSRAEASTPKKPRTYVRSSKEIDMVAARLKSKRELEQKIKQKRKAGALFYGSCLLSGVFGGFLILWVLLSSVTAFGENGLFFSALFSALTAALFFTSLNLLCGALSKRVGALSALNPRAPLFGTAVSFVCALAVVVILLAV